MTTAQLNAEIMQNLSVLADSEDMMTRVAKYLRKLVKEKKADPTLMSKRNSLRNWIRRKRITKRVITRPYNLVNLLRIC